MSEVKRIFKFDIITSYRNYQENEQEFFDIEFEKEPKEEEFLIRIFNEIGDLNLVKDLVKIDACQHYCSETNPFLKFLEKHNGKYFFNPEFPGNDCEDVRKWVQFKNIYLESKKIKNF
jgi:hypothetical protein